MLNWIIANIVGFIWRIAVTLACILTIQNVSKISGYSIEFHTLLVAAICLIVNIKIWSPPFRSNKKEVNDE